MINLSEIKIMDFDYNALSLRILKVDKIRVGQEWRTENFSPAWRIIPSSRIYFPVSGEGVVTEGEKQHILKPGVMLLVPPFADVTVSCPRELCKYWIHFNALFPNTETDVFFPCGHCIKINTASQTDYYSILFDRLIKIENQESCRQIDHYEYDACLRLLLIPFLRILMDSPNKSVMPRTIELFQYIDLHYHRKMTLNELAAVVCMHPNYLCSSFHKRMGMTLFDYINKVRMQHALEFFRSGGMTVSEVAEKTGYSSIQAFSKKFRKYFGVSPRQSPFFYKGDLKFPPEADPPF